MQESTSPEEKILIAKKIEENMVENPSTFHYSEPSFTRNLLKRPKDELLLTAGNGRRASNENEKEPFIPDLGIGSSNDDPKLVLNAPEDRFHACYIIMYILGFGTLLPWNFFITANGYFKTKLETKPKFQLSFQNYFSVAAMVPNVAMMLLNTFFLHRFNRVFRMGIALVLMLALFILTTTLVLLDTESWTTEFFAITISSMVFINMCSAVLQGGLFGFAGMLPPKYTQAVMGGQGLGGLFAAVASILSISGQNDIYKSAFGYFFTACLVLVFCVVALIAIFRLEFVKHYTTEKKYKCTCKCDSKMHDHLTNFINEDALDKGTVVTPATRETRKPKYFYVFKKIFPMLSSVIIIFLVTLACFPALTARIKSVNKKKSAWTEKYFVSVTCFLLFNLGDYVGRSIAGFVQFPRKRWPKWILPLISVARFIFIPLFLLCNVQSTSIPLIFNHDAFPIIFMLLFAMSCGYFGSIAMMYGGSAVEGEHAELAGTAMACGLSLGLGLGSASSFLVTSFI